MLRNPRTILLALVLVVVVANAWLFGYTLRPPSSTRSFPNPNGYEDLIKATEFLRGDLTNADALNRGELKVLLASNAESLRLLRLGLSRQCALPPDSVLALGPDMKGHVKELHRLADLLWAEGRLRKMDGQINDALQSYVD